MTKTILSVGLGTLTEPQRSGADAAALLSGSLHDSLARELEALGVTQLVLDDALDAGDGSGLAAARPSAVELAAWLAPRTGSLGLVAAMTTSHTEPFLLGTMSATLDFACRGRAGVQLAPSLRPSEARAFGRRPAAEPGPAWRETAAVADMLRRLWDSWEDDAIIADTATDRFVDRERLHYIDAEAVDSVGEPFTVKGPSIVPRPPQGHPVLTVRLEDGTGLRGEHPGTAEEVAAAAAEADVVIVPSASSDDDLAVVRRAAPQARLIAALPLRLPAAAVAGLAERLQGDRPDFAGVHVDTRLADGAQETAAVNEALRAQGLEPVRSSGRSLRERFGLPPAQNRYAGSRRTDG